MHRPGGAEAVDAAGMHVLNRGDVFEMIISGGGGWGEASDRDGRRVLEDVRNGRVSADAARQDYPHAFEPALTST